MVRKGFKSAELKIHAEALWDAGFAMSASEIGRAFQRGALPDLVDAVVDYAADIRRIELNLWTLRREITKAEETQLGSTQESRQLILDRGRASYEIEVATDTIRHLKRDVEGLQRLRVYEQYLASTYGWIVRQMQSMVRNSSDWKILEEKRVQYLGWLRDTTAEVEAATVSESWLADAISTLAQWKMELARIDREILRFGREGELVVEVLQELYDEVAYLQDELNAYWRAWEATKARWIR